MADFKSALNSLLSFASGDAESSVSELLKRYKNYESLAVAEYDELCRMQNVNSDAALLIRLAYSLAARRETDKFKFGAHHTEEEILAYFRALLFTLPNETVHAMMLDDRGRVTSSVVVSEGTVNASTVLPRRVLELAVASDASAVIIAHNHPLGYASPSIEDIETTSTLKRLLESSGRRLLSHYILATDGFYKIDTNS